MKPTRVIILTGPVQSGKTTALQQWIGKKNVGGFLTPVIEGKRQVLMLPEKLGIPFEAEKASKESISVGRFNLLKSTFDQMNQHIQEQSSQLFDYVIVDEIGPLELSEEGLYSGLIHLLNNSRIPLLLVVRENLVQQVIEKFELTKVDLIHKDLLPKSGKKGKSPKSDFLLN